MDYFLPVWIEGAKRHSRESQPVGVKVEVEVDRVAEVLPVEDPKLPVQQAEGEKEENGPEGCLHLILFGAHQADSAVDGRVAAEELEELLVGAVELDETLPLIFFVLLLRFLLALPRLLPFWHLPRLHRPTLQHKGSPSWWYPCKTTPGSHALCQTQLRIPTCPNPRCFPPLLPDPTRAAGPQPRTPQTVPPSPPAAPRHLRRRAHGGAVPHRRRGLGPGPGPGLGPGPGPGPGLSPPALPPGAAGSPAASPAGLGLVPFQLEPAPRPAPALPASPRPPFLPLPPPAPLPGKKSLFKLSSVRGRPEGVTLAAPSGGEAMSPGPRCARRTPPAPPFRSQQPCPGQVGRRERRVPPLPAPPSRRRRGHGVPARGGDAESELAALVPRAWGRQEAGGRAPVQRGGRQDRVWGEGSEERGPGPSGLRGGPRGGPRRTAGLLRRISAPGLVRGSKRRISQSKGG